MGISKELGMGFSPWGWEGNEIFALGLGWEWDFCTGVGMRMGFEKKSRLGMGWDLEWPAGNGIRFWILSSSNIGDPAFTIITSKMMM